jgi:hypothetical protein
VPNFTWSATRYYKWLTAIVLTLLNVGAIGSLVDGYIRLGAFLVAFPTVYHRTIRTPLAYLFGLVLPAQWTPSLLVLDFLLCLHILALTSITAEYLATGRIRLGRTIRPLLKLALHTIRTPVVMISALVAKLSEGNFRAALRKSIVRPPHLEKLYKVLKRTSPARAAGLLLLLPILNVPFYTLLLFTITETIWTFLFLVTSLLAASASLITASYMFFLFEPVLASVDVMYRRKLRPRQRIYFQLLLGVLFALVMVLFVKYEIETYHSR